ncbi:MAG: DUF4870 domain-containing protein [Proteobacteria bacterium]|nr:DUF4870 domain-containing protein [Pseudomonadota bacterium]
MNQAQDRIESDRRSQTYGMLCHLLALSGYVGIPFGNVIGPLVIWLLKKNEDPFVDDQGKESLNFQISMLIYAFVAAPLVLVVVGAFILIALGVFGFIMVVIASIRANDGIAYRYPVTIRFLK